MTNFSKFNYLKREQITEAIEPFIGKNIIKVLVGMRRVGKSFVLAQLRDKIIAVHKNKKLNIIYIDKESYEFDAVKNYHDLIKYTNDNSTKGHNLLIIDEIQEIEQFENALIHFNNLSNYDIYCTGSNAKLLSGELATKLSGRYVQFEINSLSFNEFKLFNKSDSFDDYFKFGGMPFLKELELEPQVVYTYLRSVFESIILKDVAERYNLRNVKFLENIVKFLGLNIGSLVSAKNIADFLKSQRTDIAVGTVINYIEGLKNCFLIHEVQRFDIKGKDIFSYNHKYYFEDLGIRNTIVGYNEVRDLGAILENIIYMHLRRQGYKVYVGVINNKEIDFVAEKQNELTYIQAALKIDSETTKDREFGNLLAINDSYPKYLVTLNAGSSNSYHGIKHISLKEFLKII